MFASPTQRRTNCLSTQMTVQRTKLEDLIGAGRKGTLVAMMLFTHSPVYMPSNTHMLIYADGPITFRQHPNQVSCRILWRKLSRLATSTTIGKCIAWQIQTILHFSSRVGGASLQQILPPQHHLLFENIQSTSQESAWFIQRKTALNIDPHPSSRIDLLQCVS